MRLFVITIALILTIVVAKADSSTFADLSSWPNLAPELSAEEVAGPFRKWLEKLEATRNGKVRLDDDSIADVRVGRAALAPYVDQNASVTLYSLAPTRVTDVAFSELKDAGRLSQLPRFHDYPVLGSVVIGDARSSKRWAAFLAKQLIPARLTLCGFQPRHGVRFTDKQCRHVDLLMCFTCGQMAVIDLHKEDKLIWPVLSPVAQDVIDLLLDKHKIRRHE